MVALEVGWRSWRHGGVSVSIGSLIASTRSSDLAELRHVAEVGARRLAAGATGAREFGGADNAHHAGARPRASADVGGITTPTSDAEVQNLVKRAFDFSAAGDMENAHAIFERVLRMQPNNANALVQLGMRDMTSLAPPVQETAFRRLERSFDADVVPMPVPVDSFQGYTLAMLVGRRKFEVKQFASAVDFFAKAMNSVNSQGDCAKLQYATSLVTPYPADAEARSRAVAEYHRIMDAMLEKRHIETPVPDQARARAAPHAAAARRTLHAARRRRAYRRIRTTSACCPSSTTPSTSPATAARRRQVLQGRRQSVA